jgi:hypothetical protein
MPDKLEIVKAAADVIRADLERALGSRIGKTVSVDEIEECRAVMEGILRGHMEVILPGHNEIAAYTRVADDKALEVLLVFSGSLKLRVTPDETQPLND